MNIKCVAFSLCAERAFVSQAYSSEQIYYSFKDLTIILLVDNNAKSYHLKPVQL